MPIYEFVCEQCGRLVERLQKLTDPPPDACPECGGKMAKIMSRNSFQLKGGGWYRDLYSSGGGKSASEGEKKADGEKKAGGEKSDGEKKPSEKKGDTEKKADAPKTEAKPAAPAASSGSDGGSKSSPTK